MSISHYSQSKRMLEGLGYVVGKTEMPWNPYSKVRKDLFNVFDAVAVCEGKILGLQVTDGAKAFGHITKAMENKVLPLWLRAGGQFEIHAWRIVNDYGRKRAKWEPRVIAFYWDAKTKTMKINQ